MFARAVWLCSIGCATCVGSARAALVVGNLSATPGPITTVSGTNFRAGASFSLGAGFTPVGLASITARLSTNTAGSTAGVSLWSNSGSTPGAQLADLGTMSLPTGSFSNITFTPGTSVILQASTTYWVVLRLASGTDFSWQNVNAHATDPGSDPNASITGLRVLSANSGSTWGTPIVSEEMFSVQSVPAVGTAATLAVGLLPLSHRRRRVVPSR